MPYVRHHLELVGSCDVLGLRQVALGAIFFNVSVTDKARPPVSGDTVPLSTSHAQGKLASLLFFWADTYGLSITEVPTCRAFTVGFGGCSIHPRSVHLTPACIAFIALARWPGCCELSNKT